jgi:glycerol-3-phosphate O-acyltransferase
LLNLGPHPGERTALIQRKGNSWLYRSLRGLLGRAFRARALDVEGLPEGLGPKPIYVLEERSHLARLVLESVCAHHGLPEAEGEHGAPGAGPGLVYLRRREGSWLFGRRSARRYSDAFPELATALGGPSPPQLIPVSVFWGRAPQREGAFLAWLFSERWAATGRLRRWLAFALNRQHIFLRFAPPIPTDAFPPDCPAPIAERRLLRLLRQRFRSHREALLGPDLSHRRTLMNAVLSDPRVLEAIEASDQPRAKAWGEARAMAREIVSDISYPTVRFFDWLLSWLWNRLYDGVEVRNLDHVRALAGDHTLIYAPCHRSHIDYLLLSYVLFYGGLMLPHIAAGNNLNLPVAGPLLRRGGAFFMRRKFAGDQLYTAVFESYVDRLCSQGFAMEYFIEGGRSRSGRMLGARWGMLRMTLAAQARGLKRPLAFIPVHLGYERIIEGGSYLKELRGGKKERETLFGLLRSARQFLRQRFGRVTVTFGEALTLPETAAPQPLTPDAETQRLSRLGNQLLGRVNAIAPSNGIQRLALVFLAAPEAQLRAASAQECLSGLEALLKALPLGPLQRHPTLATEALLARGEEEGLLERLADPLGPVLSAQRAAPYLLWYRNSLAHSVVLPAVVLALLRRMGQERFLAAAFELLQPLVVHCWKLPTAGDALPDFETVAHALETAGLSTRHGQRGWRVEEHPLAALLARLGDEILNRLFLAGQLLALNPGLTADVFEARWESLVLRWAPPLPGDEKSLLSERHGLADVALEQGFAGRRDGQLHPTPKLTQVLRLGRRAIDPTLRAQLTAPTHYSAP